MPLGVTYGHTKGAVSDEMAPVENEDVATFTATFANGAVGTFSASRVAHSLPDGLGLRTVRLHRLGGVGSAPRRASSRSRPTKAAPTSAARGG